MNKQYSFGVEQNEKKGNFTCVVQMEESIYHVHVPVSKILISDWIPLQMCTWNTRYGTSCAPYFLLEMSLLIYGYFIQEKSKISVQ